MIEEFKKLALTGFNQDEYNRWKNYELSLYPDWRGYVYAALFVPFVSQGVPKNFVYYWLFYDEEEKAGDIVDYGRYIEAVLFWQMKFGQKGHNLRVVIRNILEGDCSAEDIITVINTVHIDELTDLIPFVRRFRNTAQEEERKRKEEELARREEELAKAQEELARKEEEERIRREEELARKEEEERKRKEEELAKAQEELARKAEEERIRREEKRDKKAEYNGNDKRLEKAMPAILNSLSEFKIITSFDKNGKGRWNDSISAAHYAHLGEKIRAKFYANDVHSRWCVIEEYIDHPRFELSTVYQKECSTRLSEKVCRDIGTAVEGSGKKLDY